MFFIISFFILKSIFSIISLLRNSLKVLYFFSQFSIPLPHFPPKINGNKNYSETSKNFFDLFFVRNLLGRPRLFSVT